jgi:hypothetical protein
LVAIFHFAASKDVKAPLITGNEECDSNRPALPLPAPPTACCSLAARWLEESGRAKWQATHVRVEKDSKKKLSTLQSNDV